MTANRIVAREDGRSSHPDQAAMEVELQIVRKVEEALRHERRELARRQVLMSQEFEHRLINGLQLISSLLSLQGRATTSPEAAIQLNIAASRVAAFGRVHRRLHLLDNRDKVELRQYLQHLCEDLSDLLFQDRTRRVTVIAGETAEISTVLAIPLGFITNELITNAAKYAEGNIIVRLETTPVGRHSLSIVDEGPGLRAGFDPSHSKGLGMKIVGALVKQIGGTLGISPGDNDRGARFTVIFDLSSDETARAT